MLYPLSYGGWRMNARRDQALGWACARVPVRRFWGTRAESASVMTALPGSLTPVTQGLGRVLVVDDDEVIRQLIAVNLTLEGFEVFTAVDGQDCLDRVDDVKPDVITLDVMMPRLDGWVTATQLRRNPVTAGIKVVLITARAQEDDRDRGRQVGVDAYLTKPFDPAEMIRVVRELAGAPSTAFD